MKFFSFRSFWLVVNFTSLVYLLSYSGRPISDDEQLFASVARNIVVLGNFSADQLYGNLRLLGSYHGVEPAFPLLVSLWYRLFQYSGFGDLQILYFLPILVTSFSAGFLAILAIQLCYSEKTGVISGLLFGLSSMAWPYAKTLFREPLISFMLLGGWIIFNYLRSLKPEFKVRKFFLSLCFLSTLLLLVSTKIIMIVVLLAYLFPGLIWSDFPYKKNIFLGVGAGCLIGCLWIFGTLSSTDQDLYYRFTGGFLKDVYFSIKNRSYLGGIEALLAPLFSPWKGLFWYSPVCILAFVPLLNIKYRRIRLLILPFSVLAGLLAAQAVFYDRDWWTPTWGSRFLLPVVPLLIIVSFPFIHDLLENRKYLLISIVFASGFIIQLPAVIYNPAEYSAILSERLGNTYPEQIIWNVRSSPIITQWQMRGVLFPDLLLWRVSGLVPFIEKGVVVFVFLYLVFSLLITLQIYGASYIRTSSQYGYLTGTILGLLILTSFVLKIGRLDPIYMDSEFKPICVYLKEHIKETDLLVLESYPSPLWNYLMNNECGQGTWYSLPLSEDVRLNPTACSLVDNLFAKRIGSEKGVWLVEQSWINSFSPAKASPFFVKYKLGSEEFFPELQIRISHYVSIQH